MVNLKQVKQQLDKIGFRLSLIGQSEINELPAILMDNENIQQLVVGRYSGGFAVLCATNLRLLLIDKKLLYLNIEDISYDMIAEVDYGHQFIGATIHICSFSKDLKFQSLKKQQLRILANFVQQKSVEARQRQTSDNTNTVRSNFAGQRDLGFTAIQSFKLNDLSDISKNWSLKNSLQNNNKNSLFSNNATLISRRRIGRYDGLPLTLKS
ncbi:PH domain-containing protein [Candidatus Saccharibacteria bacterium]|nr:PH domain-containing protein [Candidatus Saccharibacteria bacterium]